MVKMPTKKEIEEFKKKQDEQLNQAISAEQLNAINFALDRPQTTEEEKKRVLDACKGHTSKSPNQPDRLIDIKEVGKMLGCSRAGIYEHEAVMKLSIKVKGKRCWRLSDIENYKTRTT
mgnify:CR=1 FL=1